MPGLEVNIQERLDIHAYTEEAIRGDIYRDVITTHMEANPGPRTQESTLTLQHAIDAALNDPVGVINRLVEM